MIDNTPLRCGRRAGFTLVELMIVLVILGILGAIVIPKFASGKSKATETTLAANVHNIRMLITKHMAEHGEYPDQIDPNWFAGNHLPEHPDNSFGVPDVHILAHRTKLHPTNKVLKKGVGGAYWYNPRLGEFHARVLDQGSEAATLAAYNRVNQSSESDLGNY